MKYLLIVPFLMLAQAFASESFRGEFELELNNRVAARGSCLSYNESNTVGISSDESEVIRFNYEIDSTGMTLPNFTKKFVMVSAKGFCSGQSHLSTLSVEYKSSDYSTKIIYSYRCHRKRMVKSISCSKKY